MEVNKQHALIQALNLLFHDINQRNLKGALQPPLLTLADQAPAGAWLASSRTIRLSLSWIDRASWSQIGEVLRHEMAHQYVSEVLRRGDEPAHGPAFAHAAALLGISPRASGAILGVEAEEEPPELRRIHKLLALASSGNVHEAESAMAAARRLMRKRQIELVESDPARTYLAAQVGRVAGRYHAWETQLLALLTRHFHVQGLIVPAFDLRSGEFKQGLEIFGTRENVAFAQYVYDFVAQAADRLYTLHKARLAGQAGARAQFALGVVRGFLRKLEDAATEDRATGLIWLGDAALKEEFNRRYPQTSVRRGHSHRSEAMDAGFEAGRDLTLHRPIQEGPSGETRALTDRR